MTAQIEGQLEDEKLAFSRCADLLRKSSMPLFGGLGTDIAGAKAALKLAQKTGGIVDHLSSDNMMGDLRILSQAGGFVTTPGEARTRSDLVVIVGKMPLVRQPDLVQRLFPEGESLPRPGDGERNLILLTGRLDKLPDGVLCSMIDGGNHDLETLLAVLAAYCGERPVNENGLEEQLVTSLKKAAQDLTGAHSAVFVYSAAELSEPAIHCVRDMVNELNTKTRASVLQVSGRDNVYGVNQVCGWTCGFPLRTSFARGYAEHDPYFFETNRLLQDNQVDLLIWVSAITKTPPPPLAENIPQIVLSSPGTQFQRPPEVLIEVGEPGETHDGALFVPDYGAIVAVKAAGETREQEELLSVGEALMQILDEFERDEARRAR